MAKKEKAAAPDGDEKPAGKSKLKLIIIIVVVVLLAVGLSVGGTLFFLGKKDDAPARTCPLERPRARLPRARRCRALEDPSVPCGHGT